MVHMSANFYSKEEKKILKYEGVLPTERSSNKHSQPMQQLYAANGVLENQSVCYSRHGIANSMLRSMQRL